MKNSVLTTLLLFTCFLLSCDSKNTETTNIDKENSSINETKYCKFSTENNPKSEGLRMEMFYPCEWQPNEVQTNEGINKGIVKKFISPDLSGNGIVEVLSIKKIGFELTKNQIEELLATDNMCKELDSINDNFISNEKIIIDGKPASKFIFVRYDQIDEKNFFLKNVTYLLPVKGYLVKIQFIAAYFSAGETATVFKKYESMFDNIAMQTKIISQP